MFTSDVMIKMMEPEIFRNLSLSINYKNNNNISTTSQHHQGDYQKAILYTLGAFFLIFINSMTIVSYFLRKKTKRGIPDLFMLSLAISSNLTMLAVILILAFIRATGNESYDGIQALCYIQVYFGTMLRMLDVSITTAIMIDRFLALYKPLLYRVKFKFSHGKIVCAVLWIESALIAMLPLVGFGRISMHMESFCTADWTSDIAYIVLTIAYISFGIVLVSYVGIFRAISGLVSRQETMKKSQSLSYMSPRAQHKTVYDNQEVNNVLKTQSPTLFSSPNSLQQRDCSAQLLTLSSSQVKFSPSSSETCVVLENNSAIVDGEVFATTPTASTPTTSPTTQTQQNNPVISNSNIHCVSWVDHDEPSKDVFNDKMKIQPTPLSPSLLLTDVVKSPEYNKMTSSINGGTQPIHLPADVSKSSQGFPLSNHHRYYQQQIFQGKKPLSKRTVFNVRKMRSSISQHLSKRQQGRNRTPTTKSSSLSSMKDFRTESLRFAKIMGVVVFLFYISWIPLAVS